MFALINPLRDRGKLAATFGSYGWSGEACNIIEANLKALKLKLIDENLAIKFAPQERDNAKYVEFGSKFAKLLSENKISIEN